VLAWLLCVVLNSIYFYIVLTIKISAGTSSTNKRHTFHTNLNARILPLCLQPTNLTSLQASLCGNNVSPENIVFYSLSSFNPFWYAHTHTHTPDFNDHFPVETGWIGCPLIFFRFIPELPRYSWGYFEALFFPSDAFLTSTGRCPFFVHCDYWTGKDVAPFYGSFPTPLPQLTHLSAVKHSWHPHATSFCHSSLTISFQFSTAN